MKTTIIMLDQKLIKFNIKSLDHLDLEELAIGLRLILLFSQDLSNKLKKVHEGRLKDKEISILSLMRRMFRIPVKIWIKSLWKWVVSIFLHKYCNNLIVNWIKSTRIIITLMIFTLINPKNKHLGLMVIF